MVAFRALPSLMAAFRALSSLLAAFRALSSLLAAAFRALSSLMAAFRALPSLMATFRALPSLMAAFHALPSLMAAFRALPSLMAAFRALPPLMTAFRALPPLHSLFWMGISYSLVFHLYAPIQVFISYQHFNPRGDSLQTTGANFCISDTGTKKVSTSQFRNISGFITQLISFPQNNRAFCPRKTSKYIKVSHKAKDISVISSGYVSPPL